MYKIYQIVFHPQLADQPVGTTFNFISCADEQGQAWGIAKAEWLDKRNKTVIIGPAGVPIGGY